MALLTCLLVCVLLTCASAVDFNIGILHGAQSMAWQNFRHAVDSFNSVSGEDFSLQLVSPSDVHTLHMDNRFCDVAQRRLVAVVVPSREQVSREDLLLTLSMCQRMRIPCIADQLRAYPGARVTCSVSVICAVQEGAPS